MRRLHHIALCVPFLFLGLVAAASPPPRPIGTFTYEPVKGFHILGYLIATGPHAGKFQPCDVEDYLAVRSDELTPDGRKCPQPEPYKPTPGIVQSLAPDNALDASVFVAAEIQGKRLNSGVLLHVLETDPTRSDKLLRLSRSESTKTIIHTFPALFSNVY